MFRFKQLGLILVFSIISACAPTPQPTPQTPTPVPTPTAIVENIVGRVVDMDGAPVRGASVSSETASATSDNDGWFTLSGAGHPQWVTIEQTGYITRVRAAAPGTPVLFRLSPDDGKTIVIQFAGDTMFGRRFFDPNEDGDPSDGLMSVNPTVEDHLSLLAPIQPLLQSSDLTVVNLESPFSDQPFLSPRDPRPIAFHSTKDYVFASHPNAAIALQKAGVDVVDIGNNHMYDILEIGLHDTLTTLDKAGLLHFGAGLNESDAWAPLLVTVKGQTVAFIGCTTIWRPDPPAASNDVIYVASDADQKGGAARCDARQLSAAVISAKGKANSVVVMIHGGYEYARFPSNNVASLSETARKAGANLVINHHPHVVSGFTWEEQSLTAWSLGNFIFDQTVWPTFESYMLSVYIRDGQVVRAYVEPTMIENYVSHGLTGTLADSVVRQAAGRMPGPFIMENGAMEMDFGNRALERTQTLPVDEGTAPDKIVEIPQAQWVSNFTGSGHILLGRDLLWVGGFEDTDVDANASEAPLWDLNSVDLQVGKDYAYEGAAGIRLTRGSANLDDAVTTHLHRILVDGNTKVSITGMMRASAQATVLLQVSWYPDRKGASSLQVTEPLSVQTPDTWQPFRIDVQAPVDSAAMGVFLRLLPPSSGLVHADFDNLRVIAWAAPDTAFSPLYNYALVVGAGELTLTQALLPGAESWFTIPSGQ